MPVSVTGMNAGSLNSDANPQRHHDQHNFPVADAAAYSDGK